METKTDDRNELENESFEPEYRDRLRTWLVKMIHGNSIPGLCWENEEHTIFRMPWKHAGRQDYNLEEDSKIFMAWAKHSGRYREGIDKPEPIVWKTRLRCALNKMPDIRELHDRSRLDISQPYRVYQLLPPVHKASQIRRRLCKRSQSHDTEHRRPYSKEPYPLSHSNSPTPEHDWHVTNKIALQRSSSIETPKNEAKIARNSPLSSGVWLGPSFKTKYKASMPGVQLSHTIPLPTDKEHTLHTYGQAGYSIPLTFHPTIVPFSSVAIPSVYRNTQASLAAFQLGLTPLSISNTKEVVRQVVATDQNSEDKLKALTRKVGNSKAMLDQPMPCTGNLSSPEATRACKDLQSVHLQLAKSQRKIEGLEKALDDSRTAHVQERAARKTVEAEYQNLKFLLNNINNEPRLCEEVFSQADNNFVGCDRKHSQGRKVHYSSKYDEIPLSGEKNSFNVGRFQGPEEIETALLISSMDSSFTKNAFVKFQQSSVQSQHVVATRENCEVEERKRASSPLDLSVSSPTKLQRLSVEEDKRISFHYGKAPSPAVSANPTSSALSSSSSHRHNYKDSSLLSISASSGYVSSVSPCHIASLDFHREPLSLARSKNDTLLPSHHHQGAIRVT